LTRDLEAMQHALLAPVLDYDRLAEQVKNRPEEPEVTDAEA
jgi:hypothetical protein